MLLDIGVGILLALLTSKLFSFNMNLSFTLTSIAFALLPDIDTYKYVKEYLKHWIFGGEREKDLQHRGLFHCPLIYLPVLALVWWIWGSAWTFLSSMAIFAHLLHDSVGIGWGIKWLWPFSEKSYKFFSEKDGAFSSRIIVSWEPEELRKVVKEFGNPNWIRDVYFRIHPIGMIELAFFVLSFLVCIYAS